MLNESVDDDIDNKCYCDFEPEVARRIKNTVCHFCGDSESESAENKRVVIKVRFMQLGELQHGKNKSLFQN